jgi:predicted nucleic-acid-binding protein
MHRSNLLIYSLPENRLQSVTADFIQNFSDSRKKFICKRELLSVEAVFEMLKQQNKKSSEEANSGE